MVQTLKTFTYGAMHFIIAFSVAYILTGSLTAAAAIGLVEPLVQTGAYALHEKLWQRAMSARSASACVGNQQNLRPA